MTDRLDQLEREFREHETNQEDFVRSMRTWLRGSIITILGTAVSVGIFVGTVNMKADTFLERIEKNEKSIGEMDIRIRTAEINYADIKARLVSIESAILEIKALLK
jgi:hypothetical protein